MTVANNTIDSAPAPNPQASIQHERSQNRFDPETMHYFLESLKENAEAFKTIIQQLERDPILGNDASYYDLTKAQQREITARRIARVAQYLEMGESPLWETTRTSLLNLVDSQVGTRIGVNLGLFLGCIRGNGTEEQRNYWSTTKGTELLKNLYGCFGMTELAHGLNVAGLETTATFDKERDQFIINTPHIGATKWWIGGAAHSATHCAVYARLIVDGEDYGVKTFVVPLRDSAHNVMPGVTVGDIGAKMGRDGIDNGWIQFSHVRIPRFFMLQKFCKVSREGDVTMPPLEQLSYSALLGGRVQMVMDSYRWTARFATIALRYAVGRRQFKLASQGDGSETQLLNYPLHQRRLLPYLAQAYVFSVGAWKIDHTITETLDTLDKNVAAEDMGAIMKSIEDMKTLFIDSASAKSTATWLTADCIDQCRQSCGGHGYSAYNGFGKAYNDWVVQCTWEGDNSVLAMSVGKPIIRAVMAVLDLGKKQKSSLAFLNDAKKFNTKETILTSTDDVLDLKKALSAIEVLITRIAIQGAKVVTENDGNFDTVGAASLAISKLKAHLYFLSEYVKRISENEYKEMNPYLLKLGQLYATANVVEKFSGEFLGHSILSPELLNELTNKIVPQICKELRPDVIAYTDSFQFSDFALNSSIGKYDGNIYENYFGTVKTLNPHSVTKAPYSAEFELALNRPSLEVRDRFEKSEEAASILSK
ncbi:acyl-CoA oxidase [Metschnikowia bicuspidata var. bicuspidata NRRL YB-4993]|uniref:Acyl-coenzyme A oxidase n=1 Tax=Metschnikowia bicuspidata var. bicuspidata NRRL YB-4993 TaxID=869754 RepID=A0A1A0H6Y8_9ASCO|nr:acyl-CoA oxidase [Metschnikowia bicuspidata var. bicuspidata NRRL YB-4993]OBA19720.1 acyl-CoA oxidase [Metschnikowia bicuspidata var. bicuspidata NRRL YB-4993]